MSHLTQHCFGAFMGALAVMALQGCKRIEVIATRAPDSPSPLTYLEDSVLTSRVRAALILSPVVNSANIGVKTHQGVVLLSGMAADPTQMDLAAFVAQTVPGVASVDRFMFPRDAATVVMGSKNPVELPSAGGGHVKSVNSPDTKPAIAGSLPASVESPPVSLSHPLPAESESFRYITPTPSRWVTFAHSVLGIRSIQDELLIKR